MSACAGASGGLGISVHSSRRVSGTWCQAQAVFSNQLGTLSWPAVLKCCLLFRAQLAVVPACLSRQRGALSGGTVHRSCERPAIRGSGPAKTCLGLALTPTLSCIALIMSELGSRHQAHCVRACLRRGAGAFGDILYGSCQYSAVRDGGPPRTYSDLPFYRNEVAALAQKNPDYPGSCGRCYEIRYCCQCSCVHHGRHAHFCSMGALHQAVMQVSQAWQGCISQCFSGLLNCLTTICTHVITSMSVAASTQGMGHFCPAAMLLVGGWSSFACAPHASHRNKEKSMPLCV